MVVVSGKGGRLLVVLLWCAAASGWPSTRAFAQGAPVTLITRDPSREWAVSTREREPAITRVKKPAVTGGGSGGVATVSSKVAGTSGAGGAAGAAGAAGVAGKGVGTETASGRGKGMGTSAGKTAASGPAANPSVQPAKPKDLHIGMQIKGLRGTLNKIDVQQAMEMRQGDLDVCIARSRRNVRWVSGAMRFSCKVDSDGHVIDLRLLTSNLGHRELERCVTDVVATTEFKKPSGHAIAEFAWGMSVESPPNDKPPDDGSAKLIMKALGKNARELFQTCQVRRGRVRLRVTAYVDVDGRVLSAGAVPTPPNADEKVDCMLDELSKWHLGRPKRLSKIAFSLR